MGVINVSLPADGDTIDVADYNTPITTIVNEINGNLDNDNIDASAAIAGSKIANGGIDTTQLADGAVETAKIDDEAVTPAKLLAGTGTDWVWQAWTPTYANITVGNGTVVAKYKQVGKTVFAKFVFTLGSTSSVSSASTISLPVTSVSDYTTAVSAIGSGIIEDAGTADWLGIPVWISTTTFTLFTSNTSTDNRIVRVTNAKPMSWANGDIISVTITYEAA